MTNDLKLILVHVIHFITLDNNNIDYGVQHASVVRQFVPLKGLCQFSFNFRRERFIFCLLLLFV